MAEANLKIAVFIDFDNIEIGVKSTLGGQFDVGAVLEAVKERGEVVTKFAYGDWTRATDYGRTLSQHAIHMVQRNVTPGGDKNGADINLALDALEMAFTHNHINAFVIVGGDSDFITLVEKLKQYDRKVFVVGGRSFTSQVMQKNCTEFIAYEDIMSVSAPGRSGGGRRGQTEIAVAMPLVRRALKLLNDREVTPQLGLLKSTLLQLDSSFSERAYGANSFRDFVEKLAKAGWVTLKGMDRSCRVELCEDAEPSPEPEPTAMRPRHDGHERRDQGRPWREHGGSEPGRHAEAPPPAPAETGDGRHNAAEGYQRVLAACTREAAHLRFPMYVRQWKLFLKTQAEGFDERQYGFASPLDLLRFAQREGLLRLERDRMGAVRIHMGPQFHTLTHTQAPVVAETAGDQAPVQPELPGTVSGSEDAAHMPAESAPAVGTVEPTAESGVEATAAEAAERAVAELPAPGAAAEDTPQIPTPDKPARKRAAPRRTPARKTTPSSSAKKKTGAARPRTKKAASAASE